MSSTFFVGIAGGTGCGKTTAANKILEHFGPQLVTILPHDAYYHTFDHLTKSQRDKLNFDHPNSFDNQLFLQDLRKLRADQTVLAPLYDYATHSRRTETLKIQPKPIVLVEGILILNEPKVRDLLDLKVFVTAPDDLRLIRRIQRDMRERARTLESILKQYQTTVKPMHDQFVEPSKNYADLIIPEGGHNQKALNLLIGGLKDVIQKTGF